MRIERIFALAWQRLEDEASELKQDIRLLKETLAEQPEDEANELRQSILAEELAKMQLELATNRREASFLRSMSEEAAELDKLTSIAESTFMEDWRELYHKKG